MKGQVNIAGLGKVDFEGQCMVRFTCPKCLGETLQDAYEGPVYHKPCLAWMEPTAIVRDSPPPSHHTPPETAYRRPG